MSNLYCRTCGGELSKSEFKKKAQTCYKCNLEKYVIKVQTDSFLDKTFKMDWTAEIFKKYIDYVKSWDYSNDTVAIHSRNAIKLFKLAEQEFSSPKDISENWINHKAEVEDMKSKNKMLIKFLSSNGYISLNKKNTIMLQIERLIERSPENFQSLLKVFVGEQLAVRERQMMFNARSYLSLTTIRSHLECYTRLIRWLEEERPNINSWNTIQQEDIHAFLMELSLKNREVVRKSLLILFKLGLKKKLLTHIPILDMKSRELPLTIEPLSFEQQKEVAKIININIYDNPLESLLVSFCFYHGLSSKTIRSIQMKHVHIDEKAIYFEERPPLYLSELELKALYEYLKKRSAVKCPFDRKYLIVPLKHKFYEDKPVSNKFIFNKVKNLCNFPPKTLRITCFSTIAQKHGPQILVEGFGLSLTQASRYGKLEDHLIEEQIKDQRSYVEDYKEDHL